MKEIALYRIRLILVSARRQSLDDPYACRARRADPGEGVYTVLAPPDEGTSLDIDDESRCCFWEGCVCVWRELVMIVNGGIKLRLLFAVSYIRSKATIQKKTLMVVKQNKQTILMF